MDIAQHSANEKHAFLFYCAVFIGGVIGLNLLAIILGLAFDLKYNSMMLSIALSFFAASAAGKNWRGREKRIPSMPQIWKLSFFCAGITVCLQSLWSLLSVQVTLLEMYSPFYVMRGETIGMVTGVVGLITLVTLAAVRIGFGMGVQQKQ